MNIQRIRVEDSRTKYFEAMWEIPEGISYNAYLLETDEGWILFDTVKREFAGEFVQKLGIDPSEIKMVVVHHAEPDHTGAIPELLRLNPEIEIVGHPLVKGMLESFYGIKFKFRPVKDGDRVGPVQFIHTPWLHWPETIMSYLPDGTLLSCDAFGSFSLKKEIDEEYLFYAKKYFVSIIGKYRQFVLRAIDRLQGMKIRRILPSHGLGWEDPSRIIDLYREWAEARPSGGGLLIYSTMYGITEPAILDLIGSGRGVKIHRMNDRKTVNYAEVLADANNAGEIVIGSQTYENGLFPPMKYLLELMAEKLPPRKVKVLLGYGWAGTAEAQVREILKGWDLKVKKVRGRG